MFSVVTLNAWTATIPTTTSLAVTPTDGAVTSGSAVTLTATVKAAGTALTVGQVNFCDAIAVSCTDVHLVGTAQLTSSGTASIKFIPAIGNHSYKAVFLGTPHGTVSAAPSTSVSVSVSVTGLWASETGFVSSGNPGNYTLTATVGGGASSAPTGNVSFLDTSNNNAVLGTAPLAANTAGLTFFSSAIPVLTGSFIPLVAVSDLNGDGIRDVVTANSATCIQGHCTDAEVTVLLGDGHGNFTAGPSLDLGSQASMSVLEVGNDFNGDGFSDLLIGDSRAQTVTILLGTGAGKFTVAGSAATGGNFGSIAIADFNGDGFPDVAVANTTANLITVLLGKGDGTLTPSSGAPLSTNSSTIATGDFNGDGIPDLVGIGEIYLGNGDGTFTPVTPSPATTALPYLGDFNGDGKTDLAFPSGASNSPVMNILLGNGDGTFTTAPNSPIALGSPNQPGEASASGVGDFNGDGKVDIASGSILLGDGTGSFTVISAEGVGLLSASGNAAGDLNGDGRTDLFGLTSVALAATQAARATVTDFAVPAATGSHQVLASFGGDSNYTSSTSGTVTLAATQGTPTVAVTSSASSVFTGTQVTLTATVSGSGLTPTGSANFFAGSSLLGAGTLNSSGVATYTTTSLPVGSNNITASYGGDSNYTAANSPATVVVVTAPGAGTPTMTVTPSASNVTDQQSVTVAVTVVGASGQPTPTGVLALSTGSYNVQQPLTNGAASFTIGSGVLASGSNTLTVTYLGDGTYKSVNATSTVTVSPIVVAVSSPAFVKPGAAGTATATLSASSTYSGTMKLTCALTNSPAGAQSLPTCSLNPTSVAITAGGNGTATLSLQTTAATNTAMTHPFGLGFLGFGGGSFLAGLIMIGVPSRRRRWMSMLGLLLVIFVAGTIGCGGGSSSKPPSNPGTPATTAGNYTFTVTGTDTANSSITTSATVTLTVQ